MIILAIDPGTFESGWCVYNTDTSRIEKDPATGEEKQVGKDKNEDVLEKVNLFNDWYDDGMVVVEMVASYGMPVGKEVFETVFWLGRFCQEARAFERVYRKDIIRHINRSTKGKDPTIRQALMDMNRFGGMECVSIGGVKCPKCKGKAWVGRNHDPCPECAESGWKHPPGPLNGVTRDMWAAVAVAVFYQDTVTNPPLPPVERRPEAEHPARRGGLPPRMKRG
jgi:hypothetical protein